jgi:hypothetical protein
VQRPLSQKPGEQRGQSVPAKPNPAEQPGVPGKKPEPEHDPKLRELARELFGDITDQGVSEWIAEAMQRYPELPPDEAVRKFDRDSREGFSFP